VLPDVGHFKKIRIDAGLTAGASEGALVHQGRAGGHNHPVQLVVPDIVPDGFLTGLRTHEHVVSGDSDPAKGGGKLSHFFRVDPASNIEAAVANIYSDPSLHAYSVR
jgi:hypothetical protein